MKDDITIFIDTDTTNEKELISNFEKNILEEKDEQEQIRTPISQLGVRAWIEQREKEHEVRKKSDDLLEEEKRILRHSARRR